jgi:phosphatidylserine/phosphatidylglycerophosphate/cardiolipin synthase-like enzyme/DNA/RNA endonuclease YhcR with UshA esterase domain
VVISEVYGGGGNSGSIWKNDFIELYNPADFSVSLDGWSVQYISATGTGTWKVTNLTGSIASHGFYLIQEDSGTGGTMNLPTPDAAGSLAIAATAGKVALCNTTAALTGANPVSTVIIDLVGFGTTANFYEGSGPASAPSNTRSIERKVSSTSTAETMGSGGGEEFSGNGYDSNNNAADFFTRAPQPQNSSSPVEPALAGGDVTPPSVVAIKVLSNTQLEVLFSEAVDLLSSSTAANYAINKTLIVTQAQRDSVNLTRVLLTITHMDNDFFILTVQNVKDIAGNVMTTPTTFTFTVGVLTVAQARTAGSGVAVRVRGVVTVANEFKSPSFIQDTTAGVAVYGSNFSSSAHVGDLWEITGVLKDFNGLLEIDPITDTVRLSSGKPLPLPKVVKSTDLNEALEAQLVRINNVKFAATSSFGAGDSSYSAGDPFGIMTVRVDKDSNIPISPIPADSVNIVGVLTDYKGAYQLQPRSINDIGIIDPPPEQSWMDIFAARGLPDNSVVTVRGVVTFVQPSSTSARTVFFQDRTGGIAAYHPKTDTLMVGDSIEVKGVLVNYQNLQEINPIDSVTLLARSVPLPAAKDLNVSQTSETYESQLVRIMAVQFVETGSFRGETTGKTYHVTNGMTQLDVRVPYGTALEGTAIPVGAINLSGILGQYDTKYQLMPRTQSDIEQLSGPALASLPVITTLTDTSFTVSWTTLAPGYSHISFGTTPVLDDSIATPISALVTSHSLTVPGIKAGRLYYFRVASTNDAGTSFSATYPVVTTSSQSSGQMDVYFNYSVDGTLGLQPAANGNVDLQTKLVERISHAAKSIDLALYSFDDFNSSVEVVANRVADSLIAAKNRGVRVRMVFDDKQTSSPLAKLITAGIPVQKRNLTNNNGIMHNKFFIFDGRDTTSATDDWVLSGSWNVTDIGTYLDAQNAVFIQDQSLARIYTIEFEEMFGSSGETANPGLARFGPTKQDDTPHFTIINGTRVEVYFSPSDQTTSRIIQALSTANSNIFFGLLAFTRDDIREQLIASKNAGVVVRGMIDQQPSELGTLQSAGVDAMQAGHSVITGLFHHKYGIVDPFSDASDPLVITGSHNWSTAAEVDNDENTLIIHSGIIARQYVQEFSKRYKESGGSGTITGIEEHKSDMPASYELSQNYPNPFNPNTVISYQLSVSSNVKLSIFDVLGREVTTLVDEIKPAGTYTITWDASRYASGMYFYRLQSDNFVATKKLVLIK